MTRYPWLAGLLTAGAVANGTEGELPRDAQAAGRANYCEIVAARSDLKSVLERLAPVIGNSTGTHTEPEIARALLVSAGLQIADAGDMDCVATFARGRDRFESMLVGHAAN